MCFFRRFLTCDRAKMFYAPRTMTTATSNTIDQGHTPQSLRHLRGYSETDLADRAEVSRNVVRRIEAGRRGVTLKNVAKVAKSLRLTTSELVAAMERTTGWRRAS